MGKFIYLSEDLNNRNDPFFHTLRYCHAATHKDNVKDALSAEGLEVKTLEDIYPDNSILKTPNETLAAGFNITGDCDAEIKEAITSGIPIMLISDELCFLEFIKYTITETEKTFTCLCKLKKTNSVDTEVRCVPTPDKEQVYSCLNGYDFCNKIESPEKDSDGNETQDEEAKRLKNQVNRLIRTSDITKEKEGLLPVFRYSQFLDFVMWRNYMGNKIEQVRINDEAERRLKRFLKGRDEFGS